MNLLIGSMIKLTLLENPISTQHCYKISCKNGIPRLYMSKDCKLRKIDYQWQISQQFKGPLIEYDVEMEVKLFFGTKRRVDIDNFSKLILDSLEEGQVLGNDSQIKKMTVIMGYDKSNPRIELVIKKLCK